MAEARKPSDGRVVHLSADVKIFSSVFRFFFDTTGAKKNLRKKKRRDYFALCGERQKALPFESATF